MELSKSEVHCTLEERRSCFSSPHLLDSTFSDSTALGSQKENKNKGTDTWKPMPWSPWGHPPGCMKQTSHQHPLRECSWGSPHDHLPAYRSPTRRGFCGGSTEALYPKIQAAFPKNLLLVHSCAFWGETEDSRQQAGPEECPWRKISSGTNLPGFNGRVSIHWDRQLSLSNLAAWTRQGRARP